MKRLLILGTLAMLAANTAVAQEIVRLRSAVVVLSDDIELREQLEQGVVQRARANGYDAVASFSFAPDVDAVNDAGFLDALSEERIQAVLMLRPSAIGPGSSLEATRDQLPPAVFARMREFAGEVSGTDSSEIIAVMHMAIYAITANGPELLSAGAVWLDEEVESRAEGVERLLNLVLYNVDSVRPAIRRHLGLPPLPRQQP